MKFILAFCFCILAFSESIESKNKKLRRTNEVLLKTLRELAVGEEEQVAERPGPQHMYCGRNECKRGFYGCSEAIEELDEDKDKDDLLDCPEGWSEVNFCKEDHKWPRADQFIRVCKRNVFQAAAFNFELRGATGDETVTITDGVEKSTINLRKSSWKTFSAYNANIVIRFDNDGGSRDVFFRSNDPVDIRSDKMFPGWRCGTSSENSRCEKVRNGEFYWGADYQIELSTVKSGAFDFDLRGATGDEIVIITDGGVTSRNQLNKAWQTFGASNANIVIDFINDRGSRDVYFRSNNPVDIRSIEMFSGWRCGTSSENSRCEKVRNGEFYWGGEYEVKFETSKTSEGYKSIGSGWCRPSAGLTQRVNGYYQDRGKNEAACRSQCNLDGNCIGYAVSDDDHPTYDGKCYIYVSEGTDTPKGWESYPKSNYDISSASGEAKVNCFKKTVVMDDESAVATVNDDSRLSKLIICGSDKCESHFSSCEEALEALDEDKDKHDLKKCPQTHRTLGFCVEDNSWPRADQYLRLCTLNSVFEHNGDYGAAEFVCVWVDGDGHGKSESKVSGSITGNSCAKECYNRGFNGATIKANGENGCWCEKEMTGIKSSSSYKTCHLWPMTDDLRNSFHYKPGCDDWYLQDC